MLWGSLIDVNCFDQSAIITLGGQLRTDVQLVPYPWRMEAGGNRASKLGQKLYVLVPAFTSRRTGAA